MAIDDWRSETRSRLTTSAIYRRLQDECRESPSATQAIALIDELVFEAYQQTKTVVSHMSEYTLHDGEHLFRVLYLMERIAGDTLLNALTAPELLLLVATAFYHDIGMAPPAEEVLTWKKYWDETGFSSLEDNESFQSFARYCDSFPTQLKEIDRAFNSGSRSAADSLKSHLICEYIRSTHADRARLTIEERWDGKIKFRDTDLTVEFAELCFSHNQNALQLLNCDQALICGPDTTCNLPLVGLLLRLADILDFDGKRTPDVLFSHLAVRNPVSLLEWQKHRAVEAWIIEAGRIAFQAKCEHPAIEAAIHDFCDYIDQELQACSNVLARMDDKQNRLKDWSLPPQVDRDRIGTKRTVRGKPLYTYRKTRFELSKTQVIDLLMGTKLYGSPEIALRELLQNSIDACLLRSAMEKSWGNPYTPEVVVTYRRNESGHMIEVEDNGVGMDASIVEKFYSRIGRSYYKSPEFYSLKATSGASFTPTSRFGIGILSAFMVANTVEVDTRRLVGPHESSDPLVVIIEGVESIFWIKEGGRSKPGTRTVLHLRESSNPWKSMTEPKFVESVLRLVPNPPVLVHAVSGVESASSDQTTFMSLTPGDLWGDPKQSSYLRTITLLFADSKTGIVGSAEVALLERSEMPIQEHEFSSRRVTVDGDEYELTRSMVMEDGAIKELSETIMVEDDGSVDLNRNSHTLAESKSLVSFHGIEVPTSLFVETWRRKPGKAYLEWPFPLRCVIDICGSRDLDLNSARTELIDGMLWRRFEYDFAKLVLHGIREAVGSSYWNALKEMLPAIDSSLEFRRALETLE